MTASSPPAMKISVRFSAPDFDPVTGASTYWAPRAFTRSANFLVAEGEIVLASSNLQNFHLESNQDFPAAQNAYIGHRIAAWDLKSRSTKYSDTDSEREIQHS